jgi:hypothetical protein
MHLAIHDSIPMDESTMRRLVDLRPASIELPFTFGILLHHRLLPLNHHRDHTPELIQNILLRLHEYLTKQLRYRANHVRFESLPLLRRKLEHLFANELDGLSFILRQVLT